MWSALAAAWSSTSTRQPRPSALGTQRSATAIHHIYSSGHLGETLTDSGFTDVARYAGRAGWRTRAPRWLRVHTELLGAGIRWFGAAVGEFLGRLHRMPASGLGQFASRDDLSADAWVAEASRDYAVVASRVPAAIRTWVEAFLAAPPRHQPSTAEVVLPHLWARRPPALPRQEPAGAIRRLPPSAG